MNRVDADSPSVAGPVRVQVAPGRNRVGRIGIETADFVGFLFRQIVQKQFAAVVIQRIRVGQHPFAVGRIGAVTVAGEHIFGNDFRFMGLVGVKIILPAVGVAVGEIDDLVVGNPV